MYNELWIDVFEYILVKQINQKWTPGQGSQMKERKHTDVNFKLSSFDGGLKKYSKEIYI